MNKPSANEVKEAVEILKIDKPIMKTTKKGKTITLYLYGGDVLKHTLRQRSGQARKAAASKKAPSVTSKGGK